MLSVRSHTVEFHRFGSPEMLLKAENRYIRTAGWDSLATEVSPGLDHRDFRRNLNALRYSSAATASDVRSALAVLGGEAARFLEPARFEDGRLVQVDLVTNAAELWAFPFEACFAPRPEWLVREDSGVVITRRIRGAFSDAVPPWPTVPRVLFVHAPPAADLEESLIAEHVAALGRALAPWARNDAVAGTDLLQICEVRSAEDIAGCRERYRPGYVHVLAHGAPAPRDPLLPEETVWGLRLGDVGRPGAAPSELADALRPPEGGPLVVTLAACDGANQADPVFAPQSLAQELHRRGVPVVIGSQLPLTKAGSSRLAGTFYERLLRGEDVRAALHAARVALKADAQAGHDWLSLVGYVRLPPEGYERYLEEVGLRMEMSMLDASQARADRAIALDDPRAEFSAVEAQLRSRLQSLAGRAATLAHRPDLLEESHGLRASAYKRLAELLFLRAIAHPDAGAIDRQESLESLRRALEGYCSAFEVDLRSHWLGVQHLALQAVITGAIARPDDWSIVERTAASARDRVRADGTQDHWSCGTLAELALLAPCAGRPRDIDGALAAAGLLVARARARDDAFAIASTRRQIERYVRWWTHANGFFPGRADLAEDARTLLEVLK